MRMRVAALLAGVVLLLTARPGLAQTGNSRSCTFRTGTTCWNVWGRRASPLATLPVKVAPHPSFAAARADSSGRCTALRPRGSRRGAGAQ
jgi:hypothetical protein